MRLQWPVRFEEPEQKTTLSFNQLIERMAAAGQVSSGLSVTPDNAMRCTTVQGIVRALTNAIGSYPPFIGQAEAPVSDIVVPLPTHGMNRLLKAPNSVQTPTEFWRMVIKHCALHGNFYALKGQGQAGPIAFLRPIEDPGTVSIENVDWSNGVTYRVQFDDGERLVRSREMFHVTSGICGSDGVTGLSPVELCKEAIGICLQAEKLIAQLYGNNDVPTLALIGGMFRSEEDYTLWRAKFKESMGQVGNRGGTLLLPEGMDAKEMSFKPVDAQLLEMRKFQRVEIAQVYGVPPHKLADLERATFCLPAGTSVLTTEGPLPIEQITAGSRVWSRSDDKWVASRVAKSACSGEDEIIELRTTNRTLRANGAHRILARRKHSAPRPGQGGYQCVEWRTEYVPAAELRVGDTIVALDGEIPGHGRINEPEAELCGLILGDGNVYPDWGVAIARAENAPYMDHYRNVITSTYMRYDGGNGRGDQTAVALAPVTLQEFERQTKFASVLAARRLQRLGLCGTARTKRVPEWVFSSSEKIRLAFVRGFLDADGSVDKKGRMSFSSCNETLLTGIRTLCMMCGVPVTNMRCQRGTTTLPSGEPCDFEQWTFTCSDPGSNKRIGTNDPKYVERIENGNPFDKKARAYPWHGGRDFDMPGCSLTKIVAINDFPPEPVYDLSVEGTHNFVADGVVVHNSNIEEQSLEFVRDVAKPWVRLIEQAAARDLLSKNDRDAGVVVRFDMEAATEGRLKERLEAYGKGHEIGALNPNEIRARLGLPPREDEGGEAYATPLNMRTSDDVPRDTETPGDSGSDSDSDEADGGALAAV